MNDTNLFGYATSELSQDAFICWLLSHAKTNNQNKNPAITQCALDVIHEIPQLSKATDISDIWRQFSTGNVRIDILLKIDNYKVIIEDKIGSAATDSQIQSQKNALIASGVPANQIICVFYKTIPQCYRPKTADKIFNRADLLKIFNKYKTIIHSDIFIDYVEYLENFDHEENLYKTLPVSQWWGAPYMGFFEHLIKTGLVSKQNWWGYVPNPNGGFMCLSWHPLSYNELDNIGLTEEYCDEFKLQIENDKIAVKISADVGKCDKAKVIRARQAIFDYFQKCIPYFKKPQRRVFANWMTVGYIRYDENNYANQIKLMNATFIQMKTNFKFP